MTTETPALVLPSYDFSGRRALVTGGGSGIGRNVTERLLSCNATVTVLDKNVANVPDGADAIEVDASDPTAAAAAVSRAATKGGFDIVVNAIGLEYVATAEETTAENWNRIIATNLGSYHFVTQAVLPSIRGRASIVNIASQLALVGAPRFTAYTASKGGVLGYTRSLALELAERGIRVNAVCPGAVDTPLLQRQFASGPGPQGSMDDLINMHPLKRLGLPNEIAEPVLFLCSDASAFMTGSVVVVDGGYTAI